jgi:hypothetical protein
LEKCFIVYFGGFDKLLTLVLTSSLIVGQVFGVVLMIEQSDTNTNTFDSDKIINEFNRNNYLEGLAKDKQKIINNMCSKIYWSSLIIYNSEGLFIRDFFWTKFQQTNTCLF